MHIHGHDMYILHEGDGYWDGVSITNPQNPQRRDVQMLRPSGHIVIQYDANNPGVWPFHCHIAWHLSLVSCQICLGSTRSELTRIKQGLYMNIVERPDDITSMSIPDVMEETCRNWVAYTDRAIVEQIDSGL
jgi:Multicopper oxidase